MSLINLTCASSGLPIGYLPPSLRKSYQPAIAFSSLPKEAAVLLVSHCIHDQATCDADFRFAFLVLLHRLPPFLLDIKSIPKPDWEDSRIQALLRPKGLRIFAEFVEEVASWPAQPFVLGEEVSRRKYPIFLPRFRIESGYLTNTTNLAGFPAWLASCIGLLASEKAREDAERKLKPLLSRYQNKEKLFSRARKSKYETLSVFDDRRSSEKELSNYANQLAAFFEQEPTPTWHRFVKQPHTFEVEQIERILRDVRTYNAGLDTVDEFMALSYQFVSWLEAALLRAQQSVQESRELTKLVAESELLSLQEHDFADPQALINRFTNPLEPRREKFKDITAYLRALEKFRAAQKLMADVPRS